MKREIKFRGKSYCYPNHGKWIFGHYAYSVNYPNSHLTHSIGMYTEEVNEDTIGQFTGLKDRNGVEIYEGDVVKILYTDWSSEDNYTVGEVVFAESSWQILDRNLNKYGCVTLSSINPGVHGWIEVIGNVYDNPELLP